MQSQQRETTFVICIDNADYPAALERRKVYQAIPDETAAQYHLLRIIDESGEDYLYPTDYFIPVTFPPIVRDALLRAA